MAEDWGMGGSSIFGDADLFAGHMVGKSWAQSGEIGRLQGELIGTEYGLKLANEGRNRLAGWIETISLAAGSFTADDAGLRAVIRAQCKDLRTNDAFNPILLKENRDKIYGIAHEKFIDDLHENKIQVPNGWEQQLANRFALYAIITKLDEALSKSSPGSDMLLEEGKFVVYADNYNAEISRYDLKKFNKAGITKEGLGHEEGLLGVGIRKRQEREGKAGNGQS